MSTILSLKLPICHGLGRGLSAMMSSPIFGPCNPFVGPQNHGYPCEYPSKTCFFWFPTLITQGVSLFRLQQPPNRKWWGGGGGRKVYNRHMKITRGGGGGSKRLISTYSATVFFTAFGISITYRGVLEFEGSFLRLVMPI